MNGKPPAFLFYAADWLTDTAELSKEEKGIYIDLLAYQWINGSLPTDFTRLARLISCDQALLESTWVFIGEKFVQIDDCKNCGRKRFVNPRLETERELLLERRAARMRAGKIGGIASTHARGQEPGKRSTIASSKRSSKRSTIASSKHSSKNQRSEDEDEDRNKDEDELKILRARFDRWWLPWPKKIKKAEALRVFLEIAPDDALTDRMVRTTVAFAATREWIEDRRRFVPDPHKWLRREQWNDEVPGDIDPLDELCRERDIPIE